MKESPQVTTEEVLIVVSTLAAVTDKIQPVIAD